MDGGSDRALNDVATGVRHSKRRSCNTLEELSLRMLLTGGVSALCLWPSVAQSKDGPQVRTPWTKETGRRNRTGRTGKREQRHSQPREANRQSEQGRMGQG